MEQLVARWAHNPKVVSSSLAPATPKGESRNWFSFFIYFLLKRNVILNLFQDLYFVRDDI